MLGSLIALGALATAAVLVISSSGSDDSKPRVAKQDTGPSTSTTTSPSTTPYERPRSNRLPAVSLGHAVTLRSQDSPRARVTALSVVDPVSAGSYTLPPKRGTRWVGVRVRIKALGPGHYSDAPSNGARLRSSGHAYKTVVARPDGCPALKVIVELDPGEGASGCLIFEVPRGVRVNRLQLTLSSGYAPDVGTWRLTP